MGEIDTETKKAKKIEPSEQAKETARMWANISSTFSDIDKFLKEEGVMVKPVLHKYNICASKLSTDSDYADILYYVILASDDRQDVSYRIFSDIVALKNTLSRNKDGFEKWERKNRSLAQRLRDKVNVLVDVGLLVSERNGKERHIYPTDILDRYVQAYYIRLTSP